METLLSPGFWIYACEFLLVVFGVFFTAGFIVLSKLKLVSNTLLTLATAPAIGIILWGFQGYIFGYLHLRVGTYLYIAALLIGAYVLRRELLHFMRTLWLSRKNVDRTVVCIILLGVFIQCFQMFGSGLIYKEGMTFFRINAYDGVYHLSLIQSIVRSFPPMEPGAAGIAVVNYHYWSDLVMAEIVRIFGIPANFLFFQFMPILVSAWTGVALVSLMKFFTGVKKSAVRFALIFTYFAGDLGFLLSYYLHKTFEVNIPILDNGATQFLNMPHAVAKMLFLAIVPLFFLYLRKRSLPIGIVAISMSAALFGFKIYFGIYIALGILCAFAYSFLRGLFVEKKLTVGREVILGILFLILIACIYLPVNAGAGGLTYVPLAWPRLMLAPDKLDYTDWNYRYAIYEMFHNTKWLVYLDGVAILFCLLAVHGTRIVGFFLSKKTYTQLGKEGVVFFYPATIVFTCLGLFTLQQSGGFNVYNFFAVTMTFLAISSGMLLSGLWEKRVFLFKMIVIGILLLTIERSVSETLKMVEEYKTNVDTRTVPKEELAALSYIPAHSGSGAVVQSDPDMYDYPISYLSNRATYLTASDVLVTHNQPSKERETEVKSMVRSSVPSQFISEMNRLGISYLIVRKISTQGFQLAGRPGIQTVYENSDYGVYTVDKGK